MEEKNVFSDLNSINVNGHVEKKQTGSTSLSYLSWPWAWAEVKKRYPDASYKVRTFENGIPYTFDPNTGYMVFTEVTINGITHEMWLPVMDGANHAMKDKPYTIKTKYKDVPVAAATMFDINKTIMRCWVKNLAIFGLGLYIFSGEDLPESESDDTTQVQENKSAAAPTTATTADSPELVKAMETVKQYITDGLIDEHSRPKAEWYLQTKNMEGLQKIIDYIEGLNKQFDKTSA